MEAVRKSLRDFVGNLLKDKDDRVDFSDSASLFVSGRLDSIDAVELVTFMEEKFRVDFAKVGFDQSLIDSIDAATNLVAQHGAAA